MENPTLLIMWLFSCIALAVMTLRLVMSKTYGPKFIAGDYLTMGAMFCASLRVGLIHVVLVYETNNMDPHFRHTHNFSPEEIYRRETGSRLALVNRTFYIF